MTDGYFVVYLEKYEKTKKKIEKLKDKPFIGFALFQRFFSSF